MDDKNSFFWQISKLYVDYFILGKFHRNICIFKDFKGVGQFCPPLVQIGSFSALVQIGLKWRFYSTRSKIEKTTIFWNSVIVPLYLIFSITNVLFASLSRKFFMKIRAFYISRYLPEVRQGSIYALAITGYPILSDHSFYF